MSIKPICHYSCENNPTIFDEEALTALQLAARTAGKVNEVIHGFNELEENVPVQIAEDVNKHIENGDFDEAIDEYAGDLQAKVEHLFANVPVGSTTMDAEVIDGRRGAEGEIFTAIGEAIRSQIGRTLRVVTHTLTDADQMVDAGIYYKGVEAWEHVPESMTNTAGFIVTISPNNTPYRILQMAIDWNGIVSTRRKLNADTFTEWVTLALSSRVEAMKPLEYKETNVANTWDADNMTETGLYFLGDAHTKKNTPTDNGLLIVYKGAQDHNLYQMWWDYWGSGLFYRNFIASTNKFRAWSPVANKTTPTTVSGSSFTYSVQRVSDVLFYINKKGRNGYIRYSIGHDVNAETNLDCYRLMQIEHVDNDFNLINVVSDVGADVEGVILTKHDTGEQSSDHMGGVHGNEIASSCDIFVDGLHYTMATVPTKDCNEIRVYVKSRLYHVDEADENYSEDGFCDRYKEIVFDRNGVHITNKWDSDVYKPIYAARVGMLSINKACITHYKSVDHGMGGGLLKAVPTQTTANYDLADELLGEVVYLGSITARHWCDIHYHPYLKDDSFEFLKDYGVRLKSYFNAASDSGIEMGEPLIATNHFKIEC